MKENINIKEIEKKAFRSTFQDGLWDIFLGLLLIGFGFSPFLLEIGISKPLNDALIPLIALVIFYTGKKFITVPRMGLVKFSQKRKDKIKKTRVILAISVIMGAILFLLAITQILPPGRLHIGAIAFGVNALVVFSLMAYFLDFRRLYAYAVLWAISVPLVELLRNFVGSPFNVLIAFGITGGIILLIGLVVFTRFLRDYPLPVKASDKVI